MRAQIADRLRAAYTPEAEAIVTLAARISAEQGWQAYLVGGWVRDALLGLTNSDIDISVEGDAHALARLIAQEIGAEVEAHDRFDTATLVIRRQKAEGRRQEATDANPAALSTQHSALFSQSAIHLDLVTARRETYSTPGALPTVEAGTITDDMARRDFSINAMAVQITPDGPGELVDPHGGLSDLERGLVRVLHSQSFRDDPTRLIRAVRFAERLGFGIEQGTLELALQAIRDGVLYTVSTDRAMRELLKVMEEPEADAMLARLDDLGLLPGIHPTLYWPYTPERLDIAKDDGITPVERRDAYLAAIGAEFERQPDEAAQLARSLNLNAGQIRLMHDAARLAHLWTKLGEADLARSEVYNLLRPLDDNALEAYTRIRALSANTVAWERLRDYLAEARHTRPVLTGDYLREIGLTPGPEYKMILQALLEAKLDGRVVERADEERFVADWLRRSDL